MFHLGTSGDGYFYAMEYVEGETLGNLIKRCGRVEPKIAVEIANQLAAGLAAIHEQNLVHRDIKPTNIMVSLKDGGRITAKIIDLGLAKPVADAPTEVAISTAGGFAGTPAFASPEQFAGVGVDIRSDLYSLGVVLWEMVTGDVMFRGSPAEVMYQHQHAPLPLERLKDVPQPIVVLLEKLLEKDPAQRFQTPNELLKAIPTITGAVDARRRITRSSLEKIPSNAAPVVSRKLPTRIAPKKISVARLPLQEVTSSVERRIFLFWIVLGQTRTSTLLQLLLGLGSGSPRSSTIGFDRWLLNTIALHNWFLAGPSIDRVRVGAPRPPMNFLMLLLVGLAIQIQESELSGRRAKD